MTDWLSNVPLAGVHAAMTVPWIAAIVLAVTSRRLSRVAHPAWWVRSVSAAALATALATGFTLSVAAFTFVAQVPWIAAIGHWSVASIRHLDPIATPLGVAASATVGALLACALLTVTRSLVALVTAALACRRFGAGVQGLVIVDDERPDAYALPGVSGRVVVSTAMLRALPVEERRAMLAHEASHLRHRHHLYVMLGDIAAAANPLLRPAATAIRLGVERWADEDAAADTGDRRLVARAIARATASLSAPRVGLSLGLGGDPTQFADRARALLAPPARPRRLLVVSLAMLCLLTALASLIVAGGTQTRFERAQAAVTAQTQAGSALPEMHTTRPVRTVLVPVAHS